MRDDLAELIGGASEAMAGNAKLSICTNGIRLSDIDYLGELMERGLDFIFFSLNDRSYEGASPEEFEAKLTALDNCLRLKAPVWLQRTVGSIEELDAFPGFLRRYGDVVFKATIRSVKPYGLSDATNAVFVSEIAKRLGKEGAVTKGDSPYNRYIRLEGIKTKLCSWVNDVSRTDPVDSTYIVSNGETTSFHRGIRIDQSLLLGGKCRRALSTEQCQEFSPAMKGHFHVRLAVLQP